MTRRLFIAMLLGGIRFGGSASACQPEGGTMNAGELIRKMRITLQVWRFTVAPDEFTPAHLTAAVSQHNASVRLRGLEQDLGAEQLDPSKVTAFFEFLPCLRGSMLALLSGRTVRLNLAALELHTSSAVTPETLRAGYGLEPDATSANPHLAAVRLIATPSASLARARSMMSCIVSPSMMVARRTHSASVSDTLNLPPSPRSPL